MIKFSQLSILIVLELFSSCTNRKSLLDKSEWLLGTWKSKTSNGILYETWQKGDANNFYAKSYYLNNSDTILFETIQLKESEEKLIYIVSAPKEKKELPVSFTSSEVTHEGFIFENKLHDFPQIISYKLLSSDSLIAEISGKYKGEILKEQFNMKKIK